MSRRTAPPSGMPPPEHVTGRHGRRIDLVAIAHGTCVEHDYEFPDERERYQDVDFERELASLARILEARDFPLPRLARCLELLARTTRESVPDVPQVAERVQHGADFIASHESFLS